MGCGDFWVGWCFMYVGVKYVGIDIVELFVDYFNGVFGFDMCFFFCFDVIIEEFLDGDFCFIC